MIPRLPRGPGSKARTTVKGDGKGEAEREALKSELGDVLWYISQVCTELDISLDEVAEANIAKLLDRQARGKIQGDGDDR